MRWLILFACISSLILSGCGGRSAVIEHTPPELTVDNTYFVQQGCFNELSCSPEGFQQPDPAVSLISKPSDMLGGLTPTLPLAVGSTVLYRDEGEIQAVYVNRCMRNQFIRYLVRIDDQTILVDSIARMAEFFAPIDTSQEALSYAIATTGYAALFDIEAIKKPVVYTDTIEETFVQQVEGGYLVHLFDTYLCGCGPHITQSVDVTVNEDGSIQVTEPVDAFSDPQYDDLCVD